ncbi:MAG: hypothetical protein V4773_11690 [Verrucomicrobiota bacterium]
MLAMLWVGGTGILAAQPPATPVAVDLTEVKADTGVAVVAEAPGLRVTWPVSASEKGELVLNLETGANRPLIERLTLGSKTLARRLESATWITIGERDMRGPVGWMAFFDNPPQRAYRTVAAVLKKTSARVTTVGSRTVIRVGEVTAGSFRGVLEITVFTHSPLIFVETVVSTEEEGRAILYDAGLLSGGPGGGGAPWADPASTTYSPLVPGSAWKSFAWLDANGKLQRVPGDLSRVVTPLQVARRTLVAESDGGAIAAFPPPHQYFYPLDSANNLSHAWYGGARNDLMNGYGFGIRQPPEGDRIWVPWVNAPPKTEQRLGIFYLLAATAERAVEEVGRFTRNDRYKRLDGYRTFTSHYHIEHTIELVKAQTDAKSDKIPPHLEKPGFVTTFKARGVDIAHLGEFHVGSMPRMPAKDRIALLKKLHEECNRLSDTELLVLPGEEPNAHLGGHWISFFPKPVYWVLNRGKEEPLVEEVAGYGKVYRVGSPADVLELMQRKGGLMWTAHARIKGSRGFPEAYWEKDFYRSDRFLGAAWKAMPADLSQPRLGKRVLDLLDDMANAGMKKYALAEADLFRMEPDYESYAHMNINYLKIDKTPRFGDGWQPVVDALRGGKFFASTGEVLIPEFTVGGKESGETLALAGAAGGGGAGAAGTVAVKTKVRAKVEWTFPLAFAELISGDGKNVHRQRIELTDTQGFGAKTLEFEADLTGRTWARLEVWDAARNGAFTQPVWLSQ